MLRQKLWQLVKCGDQINCVDHLSLSNPFILFIPVRPSVFIFSVQKIYQSKNEVPSRRFNPYLKLLMTHRLMRAQFKEPFLPWLIHMRCCHRNYKTSGGEFDSRIWRFFQLFLDTFQRNFNFLLLKLTYST